MKKYVGIWVDHKKAFVVIIMNGNQKLERVKSRFGGHFRLSGGSRSATSYGPQDIASEQKADEKTRHQLRRYYQHILEKLEDSDKILIFGPGEAKLELSKEIKKSHELASKIVKIEAADKMTENQIAAKVRKFFLKA